MSELKQIYSSSFPFIIDPVAYDFELNREGIVARLLTGKDAEIPQITSVCAKGEETFVSSGDGEESSIRKLYGFDERSHEYMKSLLQKGEIGLAKNRLAPSTAIHDVDFNDILHFEDEGEGLNNASGKGFYTKGMASLKNNEVAVVSFAGGMGSRWTRGAAVVKPVNPFIRIENRYRTFIEIHLAKSRRTGNIAGSCIPHVFTTSYLTHDVIRKYLEHFRYFDYKGNVYLSPAKSIGRRVYPMERDLRFIREEQLQQKLDDNVQKVQDDAHRALIEWAKTRGEGEDYCENRPILRFNPPGHWYEIPNLVKNGVLARMMKDNPDLKYLLCHNIDTLGAYIEPVLLGMHIANGPCLTFEVTPRRVEDAGGGLAKIDGHIQLIEGMALPQEKDEYKLSYYNTLTNWITIDSLLDFFGIDRATVAEAENSPDRQRQIQDAVRRIEKRIPTYVTIKNVAYLWGRGQEDIYPVAQFEKLWGDMTGLRDVKANYVSVSRSRGLQLKEPSLLDMWMNDGSFDYVKNKCDF